MKIQNKKARERSKASIAKKVGFSKKKKKLLKYLPNFKGVIFYTS